MNPITQDKNQNTSIDGIPLGFDPDTQEPVYFKFSDMLEHSFVAGRSGSGKSVFLAHMIEETLLAGIPVLVLDLKGSQNYLAYLPVEHNPVDLSNYIDEKKQKNFEALRNHYHINQQVVDTYLNQVYFRFLSLDDTCKMLASVFLQKPIQPKNPNELRKEVMAAIKEQAVTLAEHFLKDGPLAKKFQVKTLLLFLEYILQILWKKAEFGKVNHSGRLHLLRTLFLDFAEKLKTKSNIQFPSFDTQGEECGKTSLQEQFSVTRKTELSLRMTMLAKEVLHWIRNSPEIAGSVEMDDIGSLTKPIHGQTPCSIISLNHSNPEEDKRLTFFQMYLKAIYDWALTGETHSLKPRLMVFIDECSYEGWLRSNAASKYQKLQKSLNNCITTLRKYNVGFVLASQRPQDLSTHIRYNTRNHFVGSVNDNDLRDVGMKEEGPIPKFHFRFKDPLDKMKLIKFPVSRCLPIAEFSTIPSLTDLMKYVDNYPGQKETDPPEQEKGILDPVFNPTFKGLWSSQSLDNEDTITIIYDPEKLTNMDGSLKTIGEPSLADSPPPVPQEETEDGKQKPTADVRGNRLPLPSLPLVSQEKEVQKTAEKKPPKSRQRLRPPWNFTVAFQIRVSLEKHPVDLDISESQTRTVFIAKGATKGVYHLFLKEFTRYHMGTQRESNVKSQLPQWKTNEENCIVLKAEYPKFRGLSFLVIPEVNGTLTLSKTKGDSLKKTNDTFIVSNGLLKVELKPQFKKLTLKGKP